MKQKYGAKRNMPEYAHIRDNPAQAAAKNNHPGRQEGSGYWVF
jgi:hypothetical protein